MTKDEIEKLWGVAPEEIRRLSSGVAFDSILERKSAATKESDVLLTIKGYSSTGIVDEYGEQILPTAFEDTMEQYLKFPVYLINHCFFDPPIGKVVDYRIDEKGLWTAKEIVNTSTGRDAAVLVRTGTLKSDSVGFSNAVYDEDDATIIKKLRLLEISLVNIPANEMAVHEEVRQLVTKYFPGIDLQLSGVPKENEMTPEEIKAAAEEAATKAVRDEKTKMTAAVVTAVGDSLDAKLEVLKTDLGTSINEVRDMAQTMTDAEKKDLVDRLKASEDLIADIMKNQNRYITQGRPEYFVAPEAIEDEARNHPLGEEYGIRLYTPSEQWGPLEAQHREWTKAVRTLTIVHVCMSHNPRYQGFRSTKAWKRFQKVDERMCKAMSATLTSFGDEWTPTQLDSNLVKLIEEATVLGSRFPTVAMPTNPWELPLQTSRPVVYLYDEPLVDYAAAMKRSSIGSGKRTVTAKGFGGASLISRDATEDSIIASQGMIEQGFIEAFSRAIDDAIMNGDTTSTHRDTQHGMSADDHRHAWDGLRHIANADGKEYNCQTAILPNTTNWEAEDIIETIRLMGSVADKSRWGDIDIYMSLDRYLTAMTWAPVIDFKSAGARATLQVGPDGISSLFGIPVFTTFTLRNDYTSAGIYTGSSDTTSILVTCYRPAFMRGTRRGFDLESEKILDTQQIKVVGTARQAFREMRALTTEYPVAAGINIPG